MDINPLLELIERTNKYLLNLRLIHWISQKQYENLCVNKNEVKLAHNVRFRRNFQRLYKQRNMSWNNNNGRYSYDTKPHRIIEDRSNMERFYNNPKKQNRSGSRQRQQQRINRPREIRLKDFMPPQLRDNLPFSTRNLPSNFNLGNLDPMADNRRDSETDALSQRPNFSTQTITTNDTTQPFIIDNTLNNSKQQLGQHQEQENRQQQ